MKSEPIIELVEKVRWTCARGHRHMSEASATACIVKHPTPKRQAAKKWSIDELMHVALRQRRGEKISEIGKCLGVSQNWASRLCAKGERYLRRADKVKGGET